MVNKLTLPPTQNEVIDKINELVGNKQDTLVSGTNIKTINGNSVLGSGDLTIDIDEIATDLNGKADVDLSNINASQSAKNTIVGWGMPDYSAGVTITSLPYTAPADGLALIVGRCNNGTYSLFVNGSYVDGGDCTTSIIYCGKIKVKKGDVISVVNYGSAIVPYVNTSRCQQSVFYPLKGVI